MVRVTISPNLIKELIILRLQPPITIKFWHDRHRWELPGNYPVFTVVMVIYHYVERYGEFSLPPLFNITCMIINIYYPGEPVNIHIQSLINIIHENNRVITTKKG